MLEVIITTALVSVLMYAIVLTFVIGLKLLNAEITTNDFVKDISYSVSTISEDLREATSFVAPTNNNTVTFLADVNGDGNPETIQYRISGGSFLRTQNGVATPVLARNVQSLIFRYYRPNDNNNPMGAINRSQIRVMEVDLTLANGKESIQFMTKVRPRGI